MGHYTSSHPIMLWLVLVLNLAVTVLAIVLIQRRSPGHLHLLSVVLVSLLVAYPIKTMMIMADPDGFMTFQHDRDVFNYFFVNAYYFINILACMVAVILFMRSKRRDMSDLQAYLHPTLWLIIIAVGLILAYREIYADYYLDFSLVKNELRRRSLEAQFGQGWITVLMLCGLPFVYLTIRSGGNLIVRLAAVALFVSVLLVVGSRAYLLGAVLLACVARIGFSPVRVCGVLGGLGLAAALMGMLMWNEDPQLFMILAARRLMQTYDGFDLFAAYLQTDRPLLWGSTLWEDIFITYIPRFIWQSKPFLFGSNGLVATMFPDLSDTEILVATFPSGFLLEQYANFSVFGVLVAFLLFALLSRFPNLSGFKGRFVYLGLYAFAPTFFRSGASFVTLLLLLTFLAFVIEGLERALARALNPVRLDALNHRVL